MLEKIDRRKFLNTGLSLVGAFGIALPKEPTSISSTTIPLNSYPAHLRPDNQGNSFGCLFAVDALLVRGHLMQRSADNQLPTMWNLAAAYAQEKRPFYDPNKFQPTNNDEILSMIHNKYGIFFQIYSPTAPVKLIFEAVSAGKPTAFCIPNHAITLIGTTGNGNIVVADSISENSGAMRVLPKQYLAGIYTGWAWHTLPDEPNRTEDIRIS